MKMARWQWWGSWSPWVMAVGSLLPLFLHESRAWVAMGRRRRRKAPVCIPVGCKGGHFLLFLALCFSFRIETLIMEITQCSADSPSSDAAVLSWWRLFRPYRNGETAPMSLFLTSTMNWVVSFAVCDLTTEVILLLQLQPSFSCAVRLCSTVMQYVEWFSMLSLIMGLKCPF